MPFTPKFVDLVRNHSSVTGTGPVVLGAAVAGFTGFADALSAGEQFYYCIQGVDKPAEREVGRGTMQADGRIAREPIAGGLTNFTTGAKTIALVAAAEWFARMDQAGGGGSGGPALVADSVAELAARSPADGDAALLVEQGREGLFVFEAADHSAMVAIDSRRGIYVAPASQPTGASGAWVRRVEGAINVMWFGAAADFVTDDWPAFDAALTVLRARKIGPFPGGNRLSVPAGRYYLSDTLNVHTAVAIVGAGSAQTGGAATLIRFGKNFNGIVFNYGSTHGDGLGDQGSAEGAMLEGVQLWGGNVDVDGNGGVVNFGAGDSTTGHGVRIRTPFVACKDVMCAFFGGNGFDINCNAGGSPATTGNSNDFYLERCQGIFNAGFGFLASGTDANSGTFNTCSAVENGGCGFVEYSFLGNSYLACHTRDNGFRNPVIADGPVGVCTYGGKKYYVRADRVNQAATQAPGTGDAWVEFGGHGSVAWTPGKTWQLAGAYATNPGNVNGRNVFTGCYAESGQAPIQATYPSLFVGGMIDEIGVIGSATWIRGTAGGGIGAGEFIAVSSGNGSIRSGFGDPAGTTVIEHQRGEHSAKLRGQSDWYGSKVLGLQLNNSFDAAVFAFDSANPYGYGASVFARLHFGHVDIGVHQANALAGIASLADLNGKALRAGDLFILITAAAGQPPGYICTTGGTYGAGAVVTPLAPLGIAAASAGEIRAGSDAAKYLSPAGLFAAAAPVVLADAANIVIDGNQGINFNLTIGGNRTLANPVNMKPGQSGRIRIAQDSTGGRTLAFGSAWRFPGDDPTVSAAAGAVDLIAYFANSPSEIEATIVKGIA